MTVFALLCPTAFAQPAPVTPITPLGAERRVLDRLPGFGARAERTPRRFGAYDRPVWAVHLEAYPRHVAPVALVDVASGELIDVIEDGLDAHAWVYPHNPSVDSHPIEVTLPDIADQGLSDDRMEIFQCRDRGETVEVDGDDGVLWDLHICSEESARVPENGDYTTFGEAPWPENPARAEEDFVAANLYWNLHRGFDWFDGLGWIPNPDRDPRIHVVANYRLTDLSTKSGAADPDYPLATYDNAFAARGWYDSDDVWHPPRLVFGQGREIDYAYDADVTLHELGHMIVGNVGNLSRFYESDYGFSARGRSLNEGIADYFSSAIQGDPRLAEYAAGSTREQIRHLVGNHTCMDDLYGQAHRDGEIFSQGLWAVRSTLDPEDQARMDKAVFDSIPGLTEDPSFEGAFTVVTDLVEAQVGREAGDALRAEWRRRGFDDCKPIVRLEPGPLPARSFTQVPGWNRFGSVAYVPGYVQFRIEIPRAGTTVRIQGRQQEALEVSVNDPRVPPKLWVFGKSGTSMPWKRNEVEVQLEGSNGPFPFDVTQWIPSGTLVGIMERIDTIERRDTDTRLVHTDAIEFTVDEPGPYIFQFANAETVPATMRDLIVELDVPELGSTTSVARRVSPEPQASGCQHAPGSGSVLLATALAFFARR